MNPFRLKAQPIESLLMNWQTIHPIPYDKYKVDPYTRTRVILMNGTEFEQVWFSHQFSRNCPDNELRRRIALLRRAEQQQQKFIACLKPSDETILEHTIGYEQLAVDLTAALAKIVPCQNTKNALDFALLEDFDHLYRYANLLDLETGDSAEYLVGRYTEIMPGRPTVAEHRHPFDSIRTYASKDAALLTKLTANIITAAEQQTMNYYMNSAPFYPTEEGRRLYQEIAMIEEQHVTHYGSLLDPNATWLENLLMHQYVECYLYYSCMQNECDERIRAIWAQLFEQEVSHLHYAAELLEDFEGTHWQQVIGGDGEFPELVCLGSNIDYVRKVIASQVDLTALRENYVPVCQLPEKNDFARYQSIVNSKIECVPSHRIIEDHICHLGTDYRFETRPHPIEALQNRKKDNTTVAMPKRKEHALSR